MKYRFSSDWEWQIKYYINLAIDINSGVFTQHRLILLPYKADNWWFFPDIDLFQMLEIHRKLSDLSLKQNKYKNYFYIHNDEIYQYVSKNLSKDFLISEDEAKSEEKNFHSVIKQLKKYFILLFGEALNIDEIIVVPSKFGTGRTYSFFQEDGKLKLICVYRLGYPNSMLESIFAGILNNITGIYESNWNDKEPNLWKYRETVCDFFMKFTSLSPYDDNFPSSFENIETSDVVKILDSKNYFSTMGIESNEKLKFDRNNFYYENEILNGFSKTEIQLLKYLLENKMKVVTFDDIATLIWKDEWREKFSLEAIAKLVSRIRIKLSSLNAPKNLILNVRGIGYMLND